jgi:hypothetical protein
MEKVLELTTGHETHNLKISIDNSSAFKDFEIVQTELLSNKQKVTRLQLHKEDFEGATVTLEVGEITLIGREVELLKEFLNQI